MSQHTQYNPYPGQRAQQPVPPRKPRRWPWVLGIVAALFVGIGIGGAGDRTPAPSSTYTPVQAPAQAAPAVEEAPAVSSGPATSVGDGTYEVGVDLEPGRYKTAGPDESSSFPNCYWGRMKDDSGEFSALIANENLQGPGSVTVKSGEFVHFTGGCTWTKS